MRFGLLILGLPVTHDCAEQDGQFHDFCSVDLSSAVATGWLQNLLVYGNADISVLMRNSLDPDRD
jgi:hypothetical protein